MLFWHCFIFEVEITAQAFAALRAKNIPEFAAFGITIFSQGEQESDRHKKTAPEGGFFV
ncbi:hypothetical protein RHD99_00565 [Buttiauxella selenatireducens]|uniref:Uncharacterized protein n=1 Tax=Buttiauxella selenatireducens TaxID=3073902 RepID=A0ABY9SAV0_9ENTR|nr:MULTISPECIES: hypothetical protein [unclassified Buttiauxella]WMY74514.1 hypothetical protein RHD99_00565 [Buttiauxella sp. R73]